MNSLQQLQEIKQRMQQKVALRQPGDGVRVVVGMATCGIAAGARGVLNAFVEEVEAQNLHYRVQVGQTGCIGICQYEPVVEVIELDRKTTYVKMTPEKAREVVSRHLQGGQVVAEYTIGHAQE